MYNSREIGELRADVAVNCRALIERAAARGLPVLVVQTVRDAEYQRYLVSMGYAARTATVPTFHAKGVGLAFDICKNVKGTRVRRPGIFYRDGKARQGDGLHLGRRLAELSRPAPFSMGRGRKIHLVDGARGAVSAADAAL